MNELLLYGTVGSSWWDEEYFTAKGVREQLATMSGPVTVRINSGGGIATEGQAIYSALRGYDGQVSIIIEGVAASAASLIAMAGDTITMTTGSLLMIHDPAIAYVDGRGTEDDHLKIAQVISVVAGAYAGIYAKRSGLSVDEARTIMKAETYYDPEGAVAAGFATDIDADGDEIDPVAFDYSLYRHAPDRLLTAAGAIQRPQLHAHVLAMMAGANPKPAKGAKKAMAKSKITPKAKITATTASEEDDAVANEEEDITAEENGDDEDITSETDDEATAEDDALEDDGKGDDEDAVAIMDIVEMHGGTLATARKFLASGTSVAAVVAHYRQKGPSMNKHKTGAATARITRDERTTRRAGLTEALTAQISGSGTVSGNGRAYMEMSLVEIAAASIGNKDRIRSAGDKLRVFEMASHATSDFPAIFQNSLNKVLLDRYGVLEPTYRAIAKKKNFRDFREMPLVRSGDFPTLLPVGEDGEIKWGTFGESGEKAVIVPYARGLTISRQMMINDDLSAINDTLSSYGETIAYFEEQTFYKAALIAKMADGKVIFHANHKNLASAATAITTAALSEGRAAMRGQKSIDGLALNLAPTTLLVGPAKETEAEMIVAAITPTDAGAVNPFSGRLTPIVTSEITDNSWYLLSDRAPCWVYGFLEGAEAPRIRTEEPFGKQGFSMTVEHDFGFGAVDFKGGYKNPGQ